GVAPVNVTVSEAPLTRDARLSASFSPVVKRVAGAVVNVYSTKTVKNPFGPGLHPFTDEPMMQRFFGGQSFDDSPDQMPRSAREQALGSGVIVTSEGLILTNNHVVEGADEIKVGLLNKDGDFTAKVVGRDAETDIAVLKIEAKDLPTLTLADSDKTEVGDVV